MSNIDGKRGGAIVDVGNVIIDHTHTTAASFEVADYNAIPKVEGALDGLKRLYEIFGGNVTLVYNATGVADQKILDWMMFHKLTTRTGIPMERVQRTQNGRDKTALLTQATPTHYGVTVVIDDRLEVLRHFIGKVQGLYLFRGQPAEIERFRGDGSLSYVQQVETWSEIIRIIPV